MATSREYSVAISKFDKQLVIEQLRYIEATQAFSRLADDDANIEEALTNKSSNNPQSSIFNDRLWMRAQHLIKQYDFSIVVGRAAKWTKLLSILMLLIVALLGVSGVLYATNESTTINIYWLLLVLLGFNFIAMMLWLAGVIFRINSLAASLLATATVKISGWFSHLTKQPKKNKEAITEISRAADRAWFNCHYSGSVGLWQLSKITHQLWAVYLLAGLLFLVLLLMVRQYDFVWGTTLLSDSIFIQLTEMLSKPLQIIGLNTPTVELVNETRIGAAQILTAEHRNHWAQFLLGSLICFGVIPRLFLFLISVVMLKRARRNYSLDYYLPYYVRLRQQLMPLASHGQIVDADVAPPVKTDTPSPIPSEHTLPAETQWVAVELGANLQWSPESVATENNLGEIVDRASLTRVLQHLQNSKVPVIAVAVDANRPPDRGMQRTISQLMSVSKQRWLVLLQNNSNQVIAESRLTAWYRLAEACEVPADHVISRVMD